MKTAHLSGKKILGLLKDAGNEWINDNALRLSAALAYYSIFSIAPLLVIAIAIAGWVLGHDAAQGLLSEQLKGLLGNQAAEGVSAMVQSASKPSSSLTAGIVGFITLLLGATGVFGELKSALNTVWGVQQKPGAGIMGYVRERILSFGMVLVIGFLLLVSLLLTTAISGVMKYVGSSLPFAGVLTAIVGFLIAFAVTTVLFAAIFKVLPDVKIAWRDVWVGAAVTALFFELGKFLLGLYLGRESTASPYGAAASAVLVLLWVYYTSLILFYGAEFTQVYAKATGSRIEPSDKAERVAPPAGAAESKKPTAAAPAPIPAPALGQTYGQPEATIDPAWGEMMPMKESPRLALGLQNRDILLSRPASPVEQFIAEYPVALLFAALGGGLLIGSIFRHFEHPEDELTPVEHVKKGSRALALAGAAATAGFLHRALDKTKAALQSKEVRRARQEIAKATTAVAEKTKEVAQKTRAMAEDVAEHFA